MNDAYHVIFFSKKNEIETWRKVLSYITLIATVSFSSENGNFKEIKQPSFKHESTKWGYKVRNSDSYVNKKEIDRIF